MLRSSLRAALVALPFLAVGPLAGCAVDAEEAPADESSEDELKASDNTGFFKVTRVDTRKCAAPLCGGVYVARVNATKTRCADGTYAADCYVARLDYNTSGLPSSAEAEANGFLNAGGGIVKGAFKSLGADVGVASLAVSQVWKGASGATASGDFYRLSDSGIRCVTAPCPSLKASRLNSAKTFNATGFDLSKTSPKATAAAINEATTAAGTDTGFLLATKTAVPNNNAIVATEFYTRFAPSTLGKLCGTRGGTTCAAGEFCSFTTAAACGTFDAGGTCAKRPEMCPALYQPVCGCDGKTYGNACSAANQGVSVAKNGACK